jgi:hypothetical protein
LKQRKQTHQKTGIEMAYIDREGKKQSSYPIQTIGKKDVTNVRYIDETKIDLHDDSRTKRQTNPIVSNTDEMHTLVDDNTLIVSNTDELVVTVVTMKEESRKKINFINN